MSIEVYPVIHLKPNVDALEQAKIAADEGASGIYLINHEFSAPLTTLEEVYNKIVDHQPQFFVGFNLLQFDNSYDAFNYVQIATQAGKLLRAPNALWVDNARPRAGESDDFRKNTPSLWAIKYAGGVAFKYTPDSTNDPIVAAELAKELAGQVDIVVTTGRATGHPASVKKLSAMKEVIGDKPLAVASGVNADNITELGGVVDQVFVASSIETFPMSGQFNVESMRKLISLASKAN